MSFGRYGLGLWRFTTESLADATRLIETAADNCVTLLDNAAVYGGNWGGKGFGDRKSTRLNSSHVSESRMPSSA